MRTQVTLTTVLALCLLIGCATLWQTTVTLTGVVDTASKEYARLYNDGKVSAEVDKHVSAAHLAYQQATSAAASALKAYKLSGDLNSYNAAFEEARKAASSFIDLIVPFLTAEKATKYKAGVQKAEVL